MLSTPSQTPILKTLDKVVDPSSKHTEIKIPHQALVLSLLYQQSLSLSLSKISIAKKFLSLSLSQISIQKNFPLSLPLSNLNSKKLSSLSPSLKSQLQKTFLSLSLNSKKLSSLSLSLSQISTPKNSPLFLFQISIPIDFPLSLSLSLKSLSSLVCCVLR
jgi:hypothetical protein